VRWGLGHSTGVALVGLLALWLRDLLPMDLISSWGERLVGVMLIGIGLWGARKAAQHHLHAHAHEHDGGQHVHVHVHGRQRGHERTEAHRHLHAALGIGILHGLAGSSHLLGVLPMLAMRTKLEAGLYLAAFAGGTIFSMAVFSTLVGTVAARCAISGDKVYRGMMGACAFAAVAVGIAWLALSLNGAGPK
jgi:ABC-type nickel/cobalt efflux system permease component RcnA